MRQKRKLKRTIFIACEGKNTERIYFEAIGEETDVVEEFAVTVYPDEAVEDPKTHALGLVEVAKSKANEFDEVWAVFDKDGYTKHAETFAAAIGAQGERIVNIAFSSIAFEHWVLLHFAKSDTAFAKSENVIDYLTDNNFFPGYAKTAYQETYHAIKEHILFALENAAWLRYRLTQQGVLPGTPIHNTNPYTDVDILVKRLLDIKLEVTWVPVGQVVQCGTISFRSVSRTAQTLTVSITNAGPIAVVCNAANVNTHFYLLNTERQQSYFTVAAATVLQPGDTKEIILHSAVALQGFHFRFVQGNYHVMMEL
jgi:RloB-like protein